MGLSAVYAMLRSGARGASTELDVTATVIDADHAAIDVYVRGGGGGGAGGPATIADGADVAQGTTTDAAWSAGAGTVISLLKKIASAGGSAVSIADGANVAQGTTTDLSSASTTIGLLKAIKASLAGTLTVGSTAVTNAGTFAVQAAATLAAETTKVIGVVRNADGSGNLLTSTSNALDVNVKTSANTQAVSGTVTANAGSGTLAVSIATAPALVASTATIGDVNLTAAARGGYSVSSQTALTTTATVSGSAGKFGGAMFINLNSVPAYLQCFDTVGAVTLGTTPPTFVIPIPANATPANGAAFVLELAVGIALAAGLKVAATTTPTGATTSSTALAGFVLFK